MPEDVEGRIYAGTFVADEPARAASGSLLGTPLCNSGMEAVTKARNIVVNNRSSEFLQFFSGRGITFLDLNTLQCYFLVLGGSGIFLMPFLVYFGVRYEADSKYIYSNNNGSSAPNNADEEKMTPWTRNLIVIFFIAVYVQGAFWILGQQVKLQNFFTYSRIKNVHLIYLTL